MRRVGGRGEEGRTKKSKDWKERDGEHGGKEDLEEKGKAALAYSLGSGTQV